LIRNKAHTECPTLIPRPLRDKACPERSRRGGDFDSDRVPHFSRAFCARSGEVTKCTQSPHRRIVILSEDCASHQRRTTAVEGSLWLRKHSNSRQEIPVMAQFEI